MSLAIPYPARRRARTKQPTPGLPISPPGDGTRVLAPEQTWHVGLSLPGMFPFREASCPCAKAACGLVVPDPGGECPLHTETARFLQVHSAADCDFPRTGWRRKRRHTLG